MINEFNTTENTINNSLEQEKKERVKEYLKENLPESEERIETEMSSNCEVSIVIPAYGERDFVLRPLESLSKQENVSPDQYEVIIVVNNPKRKPDKNLNETDNDYKRKTQHFNKAIAENQETLDLIKYINGENIDIELSEKEKEIIKEIQNFGLKVFTIDKCSSGKNLPDNEANVGGARNRGIAEAIERFYKQDKNGIIAQSDADTRIDKDYVKNLIEIFQQRPDLVGLTGKVEFEECSDESDLIKTINLYNDVAYRYEQLIKQTLNQENNNEQEEYCLEKVSFSGANMASRAFEAAIIGGVPKKAGGEDPAFGKYLSDIGEIDRIPKIKVITADRFSPRTAVDCGHGQTNIKIAENIQQDEKIKVKDPRYIKFLIKIEKDINKAIKEKSVSVDSLKRIFSIDEKCILSDNELLLINAKLENVSNLREIINDKYCTSIFPRINNELSKIMPDIFIEEGMLLLKDIILNSSETKNKYEIDRITTIERVSEDIEEKIEILELLLDIIFSYKQEKKIEINNDFIIKTIKSNKDKLNLSKERIERLERNNKILEHIAKAIQQSNTKEEAIKKLKIIFKDDLTMPKDNSTLMTLIELEALRINKKNSNLS